MESGAAEGEGAQAQRRSNRGRNFVDDEETQLCRSFLNVSEEATVDNGQRSTAFWERVAKHYNKNKPTGCAFRPTRSLESKWGVIKQDVAKFCEVYAQVVALNTTETLEQDINIIGRALDLYKQKQSDKKSFPFLHCWVILKEVPQWMDVRVEARRLTPSKRQATSQHIDIEAESGAGGSGLGTPQVIGGGGSSGGNHSTSEGELMTRPQGSKSAKEDYRESAMRAQARAMENMAALMREKSMLMSDQLALHLFTMSESQFADPEAKEYFRLRRQIELAKIRARVAEMDAAEAPTPAPIFTKGPNVAPP